MSHDRVAFGAVLGRTPGAASADRRLRERTSGARPREMRQSAFAAFWQDRLAARTIAVILGTRAERPCRDAQVLPSLN